MTFTHLPPEALPQIKQTNVNGKRHYETPAGTLMDFKLLALAMYHHIDASL